MKLSKEKGKSDAKLDKSKTPDKGGADKSKDKKKK